MQEKIGKSAARMVRKQILLTPEQARRLRERAVTTGRPETELVREAVDAWLAKQAAERQSWKAAWEQARGMWADRDDLDALNAQVRTRRRQRRARIKKLLAGPQHE